MCRLHDPRRETASAKLVFERSRGNGATIKLSLLFFVLSSNHTSKSSMTLGIHVLRAVTVPVISSEEPPGSVKQLIRYERK
jgi:hypothetical protein